MKTFERLGRFIESARGLQREIAEEIAQFAASQGCDMLELDAKAHATIAQLRGEA